jgi:hypothetical protein
MPICKRVQPTNIGGQFRNKLVAGTFCPSQAEGLHFLGENIKLSRESGISDDPLFYKRVKYVPRSV